MPSAMADERALAAIRRIEQALTRIEAASSRMTSLQTESDDMRDLIVAHRALRTKVEGAIGQIDRLLETEAG